MRIITDYLATHGLGDYYYPHKQDQIITGEIIKEWTVLDCRDMLDESGNPISLYTQKIKEGIDFIRDGKKVVVCCGAGMSRSNAIAAGILVEVEKLSLNDALDLVHEKVKIDLIDRAHLNALKHLY